MKSILTSALIMCGSFIGLSTSALAKQFYEKKIKIKAAYAHIDSGSTKIPGRLELTIRFSDSGKLCKASWSANDTFPCTILENEYGEKTLKIDTAEVAGMLSDLASPYPGLANEGISSLLEAFKSETLVVNLYSSEATNFDVTASEEAPDYLRITLDNGYPESL